MSQIQSSFARGSDQRQEFILANHLGAKDFGMGLLSLGQNATSANYNVIGHLGDGPSDFAARVSNRSHCLVSAEAGQLPRKDKLNPVQISHAILPCVAWGDLSCGASLCTSQQDVA